MSHRTRITADAQHKHKSHRSRIPCRASLLVAAALITHALPNARGTRAGVHKRCHATSMLHCTLPTCAHPTYKAHAHALAGVHRCNRHAARPPRTPTAASPGRSPRLRRLAAALQARSQPRKQLCARPTAAIDEVAAAAAVAAETWCMHTAQPARDCQGAGYKVLRAQATEDARPTIASAMRCAGRQPPCRPRPPCRSR